MLEIIETFGIKKEYYQYLDSSFFNKKWSESSGGEKQKALILSKVSQNPDILILDEPFNHIDQKSIKDLTLFFNELLIKKIIKSLVIISHIKPNFDDIRQIKKLEFK